MIGLIPILIMILAAWYTYEYGDQLLEKITKMAAEQAASMTTSIDLDSIQKMIQGQ